MGMEEYDELLVKNGFDDINFLVIFNCRFNVEHELHKISTRNFKYALICLYFKGWKHIG